mmetsp:Transcript_89701/g.175549  ORF Transcript_89701/g.175549 Transcript_89701/m.175549 type:complete len:108 (+) Transcript_89701:162-485(+)
MHSLQCFFSIIDEKAMCLEWIQCDFIIAHLISHQDPIVPGSRSPVIWCSSDSLIPLHVVCGFLVYIQRECYASLCPEESCNWLMQLGWSMSIEGIKTDAASSSNLFS